jgi:hypothetical protein
MVLLLILGLALAALGGTLVARAAGGRIGMAILRRRRKRCWRTSPRQPAASSPSIPGRFASRRFGRTSCAPVSTG